ncbi:hypothetical protein BMI84_05680 [Vibrio parahaemolyticus]|nr:hypothetical protein BMI84_05680 [Vibrio parahaemolyticus]
MKFSKSLLVVAVGAALAGCGSDSDNSPVTCETADSCTKFTVLHTNDNHGRFWENSKGEYGMAARKTLAVISTQVFLSQTCKMQNRTS